MDTALIRFRGELYRSAERRIQHRRRRRRTVLVLAALGALTITGGSIAAIHLRDSLGSPAPANVVHDFGSYATPLGFHPNAGGAVLVARDEKAGVALYATPNAEGTSCVTFTAPWKTSPGRDDGGTCIAPADAGETFLAGWVGGDDPPAGPPVGVIAGRVTTPDAVRVRFSDANGEEIVSPLGAGGYFIAVVDAKGANLFADYCPPRDWAPTFTALGANGQELAGAAIPLERVIAGGCGFPVGLHGP